MATKQLKKTPAKVGTKSAAASHKEEAGDEKYRCSYCGKEYGAQAVNFYSSSSPIYAGNNKRMTICKKCVDNMLTFYTAQFDGDYNRGMERVCQITDMYFDKKRWQMVLDSDNICVGDYIKSMNLLFSKTEYKDYSTSFTEHIEEEQRTSEALEAATAAAAALKEETAPTISLKTKQLFGVGFKDDAYESLQFEYDNWVEMYGEPTSKKQRELYITLCYLKLQLGLSVQNGETNTSTIANSYKGVLDAVTTEMEDRKKKDEASLMLSPLGVYFQDIEKYTPAEFFKNKKLYEDVDHFKEYSQRFIFRPLKNLLTGSKDADKEFNLSDTED